MLWESRRSSRGRLGSGRHASAGWRPWRTSSSLLGCPGHPQLVDVAPDPGTEEIHLVVEPVANEVWVLPDVLHQVVPGALDQDIVEPAELRFQTAPVIAWLEQVLLEF